MHNLGTKGSHSEEGQGVRAIGDQREPQKYMEEATSSQQEADRDLLE